jgi:AcrR family transcriptional regulator
LNNQERRTQTRNAILEAATAAFAADGYEATGVAEICERAGVSKGAFYYHFESKEAVFLDLCNIWLHSLEETLTTVIAGTETVPAGLRKMAGMMEEIFNSNNSLMSLFLELWTHASRNEKVRAATLEPYRRFREIFSALILKGIEEGSIAPIDTDTAGQVLLSLSSGLFLQASLDPESTNWGKTLQDSIDILFNGLKGVDVK